MNSPSDPLFQQIGHISALATICEVKMRILADNNKPLKHLAHAKILEDVENAIIRSFEKHLATDEVSRLKAGRVIRNKVLHGDFEAASIKLEEIESGKMCRPEGVALEVNSGELRDIGLKSIKSSSIFEWLIVVSTTGFFPLAMEVLEKNLSTINRIIDQTAKDEIAPGPL